jgi:hypothetical protein
MNKSVWRLVFPIVVMGAVLVVTATASSIGSAGVQATCKPKRYLGGDYACFYYGYLSGTHTERWNIDYDALDMRHPPGTRCRYATAHESGTVHVEYISPRTGRRRASFVVRWRGPRQRPPVKLAPYTIEDANPFTTVSANGTAVGWFQSAAPPPRECAGAVDRIDGECGEQTAFAVAEFATYPRDAHTASLVLSVPNPHSADRCPGLASFGPATVGAATKDFRPSERLKGSKFTFKGRSRVVLAEKIAGKVVGRRVETDEWTWTFCEKRKVKPAQCRP